MPCAVKMGTVGQSKGAIILSSKNAAWEKSCAVFFFPQETDGEVRMPSEKSLENLKKGKGTQFKCGDSAAINARKNSHESQRRNIAARKAFKDALALMAGEVLSDAQVEKLRKRGIEVDGKTLLEIGAASTLMQWIMGDMDAGKLAMEISGNDDAAERRKIEREKLAFEREKFAAEQSRAEQKTAITDGIIADIIKAVADVE